MLLCFFKQIAFFQFCLIIFIYYNKNYYFKDIPPITKRAKQVKSELEETKALRNTIKSKENDVLELKMALRSKQEEIGELNVRKELAEKKLSTTIHESEISIEKLQVMAKIKV